MARAGGERGSGLVSTWIGFFVFVLVLQFGVQLVVNLYATSALTAATYDAARLAAAGGASPEAQHDAERHARRLLGRYGPRVDFDWSGTDADTVVLRVVGQAPGLLPAALAGPVAFGRIDRTARVRTERFR